MPEPLELIASIDEAALIAFVTERRWFGSKSREVAHAGIVDAALVRTAEPLLAVVLVELRFQPGTHETYQLLVGLRPESEGWSEGLIATVGGWTAYDALADPALSRELVHLIRGGFTQPAGEGVLEFRPVEGFAALGTELAVARPIPGEQSNSSIVFDEELILKAFRRLEAGINPELELLRFLTEHGFENIAQLGGFYAYAGKPMDATLGVLQRFVRNAQDGWELALDELGTAPERFLQRLHRLGEVTGTMHTILGSDPSNPSFCPETSSVESLGLLTATVDEEIENIFLDLPDTEAVAPILGRGEEVREQLRLLTHFGAAGRIIRHHGDFHLGQTLFADDDWMVLDFEGEPARSLHERRRKRSPLRDVAGMMRSFAYATSASQLLRGVEAPAGWEERARAEFLAGYLETADSSLLPPGQEAIEKLLMVFELEKAVYELRYELNNRPDWVKIPVAGILRLLETAAAA
ncbi:MAG: maltokinase N-terminal cap-like domain-containing protein [Gaiellaceae bacterium]